MVVEIGIPERTNVRFNDLQSTVLAVQEHASGQPKTVLVKTVHIINEMVCRIVSLIYL